MGDKLKNFLGKTENLLDKVKSGMNKSNTTQPTDTPFENFVNNNVDGINLPATPVTFPKWMMVVGIGFLLLFVVKFFKKTPKVSFRKKATNRTEYKKTSSYKKRPRRKVQRRQQKRSRKNNRKR